MKPDYYKKLVRKLLTSEIGRATLSEQLGAKIAPRNQLEDKAVVATLTPCYQHPEPAMTEAYVTMCDKAREAGISVYNGSTIRNSSVVHWSRNQLLGNLIKSGKPWTHVLFIDDDIVAPPDSLVKMVAHNKDIIGALCTRRSDPPIPTHRYWDERAKNFREIFEWGEDGLQERGGIGTGMILISRHALELVADAWFNCKYEKEVYGVSDDWVEKHRTHRLARFDETGIAFWFDFLYHLETCDSQYGEDMSFCLLATRYCDLKIYVDTSIQPDHLGEYGYGIKDFLPFRKQVVEDYQHKLMVAATLGKELPAIQKPEQEPKKTSKISVILPARGRPEKLAETIDSLFEKSAVGEFTGNINRQDIEVLIRVDDDEHEKYGVITSGNCLVRKFWGERHGYEGLHIYYNQLAVQATGDWIMLWNDDALMETEGWDAKIHEHGGGLKVLNLTGKLNLFPVISRELYEILGHVALQPHTDSWLQVVGRLTGIEEDCPLQVKHTPRENYATSKQFFSRENLELLQADIDKVKAALQPQAVPA